MSYSGVRVLKVATLCQESLSSIAELINGISDDLDYVISLLENDFYFLDFPDRRDSVIKFLIDLTGLFHGSEYVIPNIPLTYLDSGGVYLTCDETIQDGVFSSLSYQQRCKWAIKVNLPEDWNSLDLAVVSLLHSKFGPHW